MKILIFSAGNVYEKEIAYAFQKAGIEYKFITTYPKYLIKKYSINKKNIKSLFFLELLKRFLFKFFSFIKWRFVTEHKLEAFIDNINDYFFSYFINKKYDLLIILTTTPWIRSINKANKISLKILCHLTISSNSFRVKTIQQELKKLSLENNYPRYNIDKIIKTENMIQDLNFVAYQSSYQLETYKNAKFDTKNFFYLPQPSNTKVYSNARIQKNNEKFIITFTGNDFVRKGGKYLIDAFNNLSLKNAELWMIGVNLEKYAKLLNLNCDKIKFFGPISDLNIRAYYEKSSIFCLPSFEEGLPIVIPKAMTFGLPIITTQYGSDIIRNFHNGFIVKPGSSSELAEKIKFLYDNPNQLEIMSKNVHLTHDKFFTPKIYTDKILSTFFKE